MFDWNEWNLTHIGRHGVTPQEVEEVAFDDDPHVRKMGTVRYLYGYTLAGRYLFTVYLLREPGVAWVVTSREMDEQERRLYRTWRKRKGR